MNAIDKKTSVANDFNSLVANVNTAILALNQQVASMQAAMLAVQNALAALATATTTTPSN